MFGWDFEVDTCSRFWRWEIKICVRICNMISTLGSVVPLAMFSKIARNKGFEVNDWWRCKSPIIVTLSSQIRFQTEIKFTSNWMKRPPQNVKCEMKKMWSSHFCNAYDWTLDIFPPCLTLLFVPQKKVFVAFLPWAPINMLHMIIPFAQTVVGHYLVCWAHSSCILMILDHQCYLWDLSHCRKTTQISQYFKKSDMSAPLTTFVKGGVRNKMDKIHDIFH